MRIYVASSWRNDRQPAVVDTLRAAGHEVYDFRHPEPGNDGFHWSEIDPSWQGWDGAQFASALAHPIAEAGYGRDRAGLDWCDTCVLVLPSGRSAHLEAGYAVGQGKPTVILLDDQQEPELMYKLATTLVHSIDDLLACLGRLGGRGPTRSSSPPAPGRKRLRR